MSGLPKSVTIEAYFQVLEMMPVPVVIWNHMDGILYANRQASILVGYDRKQLLDMEISDLVSADSLEKYVENATRLGDEEPGARLSVMVNIRLRDGRKVRVELIETITPTDDSYVISTIIKDLDGPQRQIENHLERVNALTKNIMRLEDHVETSSQAVG